MNLQRINSLFFALLPLTLFGYQLRNLVPLVMGSCLFFVVNTFVSGKKFTLIIAAALIFVGAALMAMGDLVILVCHRNFTFDLFYTIIGFGLSFAFSTLTSLLREENCQIANYIETTLIASIHIFFLLSPGIGRYLGALTHNDTLAMAITLAFFFLFCSGLIVLHQRACATLRNYRLVPMPPLPMSSPHHAKAAAGDPLAPPPPEIHGKSVMGFNDAFLAEKWAQMVVPCLDRLRELRMDSVVLELFTIFATVGRNVPSVYGLDNAATRYSTQDFELLSQVTLTDHSFRVAELAMDKIQYRFVETWQYLWPQQLIISLGHDIAKIPHLAGDYTTKDHGVNSANCVASVFRQYAPELQRELIDPMLDAIRDHHKKFDDNKWAPKPSEKLKLLMECDKEAREIEKDISRKGMLGGQPGRSQPHKTKPCQNDDGVPGDIPITPPEPETMLNSGEKVACHLQLVNDKNIAVENGMDDDIVGCETEEFIKPGRRNGEPTPVYIRDLSDNFVQEVLLYLKKNYLNRIVNKAFYAVSQKDGYVYCWTDTIYDLIQIIAERRNSQSFFLFVEKYKYSVLLSFYRNLKAKGLVPPDEIVNSDRYFANTFTFFNPKKKEDSVGFYMLIAAEAFGEAIAKLEEQRFDEPELAHITMKLQSKKTRG